MVGKCELNFREFLVELLWGRSGHSDRVEHMKRVEKDVLGAQALIHLPLEGQIRVFIVAEEALLQRFGQPGHLLCGLRSRMIVPMSASTGPGPKPAAVCRGVGLFGNSRFRKTRHTRHVPI